MKSKIISILAIFLMLSFIAGCETLEKIMPIEEAPAEEPAAEEEISEPTEEVQPSEEPAAEPEPAPEETTPSLPEEPVETPEEIKVSETTILTVTPKTVKPTDLVTIKVTPNNEYGYKTTVKIYDVNEDMIKQAYIQGCGSICKKEKSTTLKAEYNWEGDYCAKVVDVETNEEVEDCFKVE